MKQLFHIAIRRVLTVAGLIVLAALGVHAQDPRLQLSNLDRLAAKASSTVDVNIDERLIQIASRFLTDADDADVKKLVDGLKGIYVKSFEFENEGEYTSSDVESIRAQLRGPAWSRLINVASRKDGNVEVYVILVGEKIGGLAVLSAEAKELTVVNIVGPVDLEKLVKLEGQFGVPDLGIESAKPKTKNDR